MHPARSLCAVWLAAAAWLSLCPSSARSAAIDASECVYGLGPLPVASQRVFAHWFNNSAFAPSDPAAPYQTASEWTYHSSLSFSLPADVPPSLSNGGSPLSFQAHGHLVMPRTANYSFRCQYRDNRTMDAKVWLDDHLLCPEDLNNQHLMLPFAQGGLVHIRVEAIQNSSWPTAGSERAEPVLSVLWSVGSGPTYVPIPSSSLAACMPHYRQPQHALHARQLQVGWDRLLHSDVLTMTLLPHGLALTVGLYQRSTGVWQSGFTSTRAVNGSASTTPILRIGDRTWVGERSTPYQQVQLTWQNVNLTVESTQLEDDSMTLLVSGATPSTQANYSDYLLLVSTAFIWGRTGQCSQLDSTHSAASFAACAASGISPSISFFSTAQAVGRHLPGVNETAFGPFTAFAFNSSSDAAPSIAFTSHTARPLPASHSLMAQREAALPGHECHQASLDLYENCILLHDSMSWLTIFTPYEGTVIVQTRDWDFGSAATRTSLHTFDDQMRANLMLKRCVW